MSGRRAPDDESQLAVAVLAFVQSTTHPRSRMERIARSIALGVAGLLGIGRVASATPTQFGSAVQYDVCGGSYAGFSGFGLCASVNVRVLTDANATYLQFQVYNTSGTNGSYAGSAFTRIGMDHLFYNGQYIGVIPGTLDVWGPCANDPQQQCQYSKDWTVQNDFQGPGGINVDLINATINGVNSSVVSDCIQPGQVPASGNIIYTSCTATAPLYAQFTFQINTPFDPAATGALYIVAQNGYQGQTTFCSTYNNLNCSSIVVPEPTSVALVASGLSMLGVVRIRRRRRTDIGEGSAA